MNNFVEYKIAKRLKDIGFDEECLYNYNPNGILMSKWYELNIEENIETVTIDMILNQFKIREDFYKAPAYYQVFQWFRTKHNIHSSITWVTKGYDFYIKKEPTRIVNETTHIYSDYRECEIACIEYMIKMIET